MRIFASNATPSLHFAPNGPNSTRRSRLQGLVERHLPLKPINATQYDSLKSLPERPARLVQPGDPDPIGSMISTIEAVAGAKDCRCYGCR